MKVTLGNQTCCWLLFFCAGCAHTVTVTATGKNTTDTPIPSHVTYVVLPTNEVEKDRAFPQYAKLVTSKMDARGYKQTTEKTAQLGVFLAYGTNDNAVGNMSRPAPPPTGMSGGMGPGSSGGGVGYGTQIGSPSNSAGFKTYTNQVVIVVVDLQKSRTAGSAVELWRGETTNTGSSNDLPQLAPLLVDAAFRHFGDTTSNLVRHTFDEEAMNQLRDSK